MRWYWLGAGQGNAEAQFILGVMYEQGRGVPRRLLRAHMWFNLAASQSSDENGKLAINNREIATRRLTGAQLFQAQEIARQCVVHSARDQLTSPAYHW
jgi:uncharacterized protein